MLKPMLLALALAAVGCKDASKDVEALADRACACKTDAVCGKAVLDDFVKWAEDNVNARGDEAKAEAAGKKLVVCVKDSGVALDVIMTAANRLQQLAK